MNERVAAVVSYFDRRCSLLSHPKALTMSQKLDPAFDQVEATRLMREQLGTTRIAPNKETACAIAAYVAFYSGFVGNNKAGLPMTAWSDLPEQTQDAWRAAANAAAEASARL